MNWLKKLISKKSLKITNGSDFWNWFVENESRFFNVLKKQTNVEKNFIQQVSPRLKQLNEGFYFLGGMYDDNTAELIITADGNITLMPYIEDLVKVSPRVPNWKFTAHKPPVNEDISIDMSGYLFNNNTIRFFPTEHKEYPDEIEINIVYKDYNEEDNSIITNGVFIFLENYLGEIQTVTEIDKINIVPTNKAPKELIDIDKLSDYLIWRQKEFLEKYNGIRYNTEEDEYSKFEAIGENGLAQIAAMNSTLLKWDSKASHPWMIFIDINYDGTSTKGMPNEEVYHLMNQFEDEVLAKLKDFEGYLNLGRETGNNLRTIYFACKDFQTPIKTIDQIKKEFSDLDISMDVFKDKYWMSLNRYIKALN